MDPKDLQLELDRIKHHLQSLNAMVAEFESKLKTALPESPVSSLHAPPRTDFPQGIPVRMPPPSGLSKKTTLEGTVGIRWMVVTGVIALLIALGFELRLAMNKGWLTEPIRCALGVMMGLGFFAAGSRLRERYPRYGEVLMSGGVVAIFLGIYAAHSLYKLLSGFEVIIALLTVGWGSALLSWKSSAKTPIYLGVLGCYLAPFLVDTLGLSLTAILVFLAIVNSSYVLIAWVLEDLGLQTLTLYLATGVYVVAWYVQFSEPASAWPAAFCYQVFQAVAFSCAAAAGAFFRGEGLAAEKTWLLFPAILLFYYLGGDLLLRHAPAWHWLFGVATAGFVFAVAHLGRLRLRLALRDHTPSIMTSLVAMIIGFHLISQNFDKIPRSFALFFWFYLSTGIWLVFKRTPWQGIFLLFEGAFLAVTLHFQFGYSAAEIPRPFFNTQCLLLTLFSASLVFFAVHKTASEGSRLLGLLGHGSMLRTLFLQAMLLQGGGRSLHITLLWLFYAGMILAIGFFAKNPRLRTAALWIFGLCTIKVFLYDTLASSLAIKVQSYLFLGVTLIVGGYYYQRLKAENE